MTTATKDGGSRLSRSVYPDIAPGGANAAQRTRVRLDLILSETPLREVARRPCTILMRRNVSVVGPRGQLQGRGSEQNDSVNVSHSEWHISLPSVSIGFVVFGRFCYRSSARKIIGAIAGKLSSLTRHRTTALRGISLKWNGPVFMGNNT